MQVHIHTETHIEYRAEAHACTFTQIRRANVHCVNACRTAQRFSVVEFSCTHAIKKHTQTQAQVRESRWRRNWQASFYCAPTIQQAFLYRTANAFPFTHKHSSLLFLSPLQSSIILSPHRHSRQVEWEKVKLICGHVLCYCFNKNSLWTWLLHKYNKEAFGKVSIMSTIQASLQIFCNGSLARISPNISQTVMWFFLIFSWWLKESSN